MNSITLPIAELRPALAGLSKVISKRSTLPVLGCVQVQRHASGIVDLTVTDLDHHVTCSLASQDVAEPATLLVPFEDLNNVAKSCGNSDQISVTINGERTASIRFLVAGQSVEHHCDTVPAVEFPAMPKIEGKSVMLNDALRDSIHHAIECSSSDTTRAILQGAFLDVSRPGAHYVVGTDGRHLFSSNSFVLPLAESVIIPEHKFLGWKGFNQDGQWKLRSMSATKEDSPQCELATDHWRFVSRCVEGQYPNWKAVIPSSNDFKTSISIDPEKLDQVVIAAQRLPIYEDKYHTIGIEVTGNRFSLLGKSRAELPWTKIVIEDAGCTGTDITILIDKRMLLKALRFGLTRIDLIDEMAPITFSLAGRTLIVMPLRPNQVPAPTATQSPAPIVPATAQTNPPPSADQPTESTPMQTDTINNGQNNTNGVNGSITTTQNSPSKEEPKPALESALQQIETIKTSFRETIASLTKLSDAIRLAMREQKSSEKEVQNVRQTLRSLQSVRL